MEFLAEFGPLRQLDHYGAHLNFIQYYLVDVIAFLSLIVLMPLVMLGCCIRKTLSIVACRKEKSKRE